jgi:hypothetical protein
MRALGKWSFIAVLVPAVAVAISVKAGDVTQTKTVGVYRVELDILPVESFFSKQDVADKHVKEGMEIEGGAAAVAPNADSHPNHHLVVHVFDTKSHRVITDATVMMSFVPLDGKGSPSGAPVVVPVVIMQMIGKGAPSTHYGNNVTMPAGRYSVTVTVNHQNVAFGVAVSDAPSMPMGQMKM